MFYIEGLGEIFKLDRRLFTQALNWKIEFVDGPMKEREEGFPFS